MRFLSGLIVCLLASASWAEEAPGDIVDRAIKARSVRVDALDKQRTQMVTMEGKIFTGNLEILSTKQVQMDGPGNVRWDFEMAFPDGKKRLIMALQGNKGWQQFGGMEPEDLSLARIEEFKMETNAQWFANLSGLKDRAISLTKMADAKVGDEEAYVLKAALRFRSDVQLSFSKKTGHLLKVAYKAREQGAEVRKEHIYSDYKPFNGILLPSKQIDTTQLNGPVVEKKAEWIIKDYKFVEKWPADAFNKPEKK